MFEEFSHNSSKSPDFDDKYVHKLPYSQYYLYFKKLVSIMHAIAQSARKNSMIFCSQILITLS